MRAVTVRNTTVGGAQIAYVADHDCNLVNAVSNANVTVSRNVNETVSNFKAGVGDSPDSNGLLFVSGTDKSCFVFPINLPVFSGETLWLVFAAVGSIILYFDV